MILSGLTETIYHASLMSPDTEIQAEVDFFPHSLFNKSTDFGFDFQIKANLACNLKKINLWPFGENHKITKTHPFADIMARNNRVFNSILNVIPDNAVMRGVQVVYRPKAAQLRRQRAQDVKMYIEPAPQLLWRMGIPWTFADSPVVLLNKDSFPMSRDMAENIFKNKNVFMDIEALKQLAAMTVPEVQGVKISGLLRPLDHVQELILDDERTGSAAGDIRGIRASGKIAVLKTTARSPWRPLTRFIRLDGKQGTLGMLVAEKAGRRILISAAPLTLNRYEVAFVDDAGKIKPIPAADVKRKHGSLQIILRAGTAPHPFQVRCILVRTKPR